MPLRIYSEDRDEAVRLLTSLISLATAAQGTTAVIRLISWIEAREEDEGGFLWLAGVLGIRPNQLDTMLRSTIKATPRRRQAIERKITSIFWTALHG